MTTSKKRYQIWHIDGWTLKIITKVTVLNFSKEVSCKNIVIITYFHNNDYAILIGRDQISFFLKPSWNVNNKAFGNMVFKFLIMGYKIRSIFGHNRFIKRKLSCRTTKVATCNDRNSITSKKPGTVLSMQNVDDVPIS